MIDLLFALVWTWALFGLAVLTVIFITAVLLNEAEKADRRAEIRARANERVAQHEALPYDRDRWSA